MPFEKSSRGNKAGFAVTVAIQLIMVDANLLAAIQPTIAIVTIIHVFNPSILVFVNK